MAKAKEITIHIDPEVRELAQMQLDRQAERETVGVFKEEMRAVARSKALEVMERIERNSMKAIDKIGEHVDSLNPEISLRAAIYTVDHVVGKATQKSITRVERYNIDVIAD